ncbi:MAG TPA: hypothetical protein VLK84_08460 [Longimicrobium sp.]|nr:hypothetical protein [Longimicrobium sp.]
MLGKRLTPSLSAISREQFHDLTRPLVGLPVSHTWRGAGSAIFLELGFLTDETWMSRRGERTMTRGQVTLMLEWSWRVETPRTIRFGSWSSERRITHGVQSLQGHVVTDVAVTGRIPELVVTLDRGRWVHTFMTAEGEPAWYIRLPDDSWLKVLRGRMTRQVPWDGPRNEGGMGA